MFDGAEGKQRWPWVRSGAALSDSQPCPSFTPPCFEDALAIFCTHPCPKARGSFAFPAGAAEGALGHGSNSPRLLKLAKSHNYQ